MCAPARLLSAHGKGSHVALTDARTAAHGDADRLILNVEESCGLEYRLAPPAATAAFTGGGWFVCYKDKAEGAGSTARSTRKHTNNPKHARHESDSHLESA